MKTKLLIIIILLSAILPSRAETADYKLNVQDFSELTVVDGICVNYETRTDSAGWAVFSCEPEKASKILFSNRNNCLSIQTDAEDSIITGMPTVTVYSTVLTKVENSGDSVLNVTIAAPTEKFKAKQIGNGSINVRGVDTQSLDAGITTGKGRLIIEGKADKATFNNVSTGPIDASELVVRQVKCVIFGTGDIDIYPTEQLRIYGAGSGAIYYHNFPTKISNRSIGVKSYAAGEGPRADKKKAPENQASDSKQ